MHLSISAMKVMLYFSMLLEHNADKQWCYHAGTALTSYSLSNDVSVNTYITGLFMSYIKLHLAATFSLTIAMYIEVTLIYMSSQLQYPNISS